MVKTNVIKGKIVEKGFTIQTLAPKVGVSPKTLYTKLNQRPETLTQDEMEKLISVLSIDNPEGIFFATE